MVHMPPVLPSPQPRTVDEAIEWITFGDPRWEPGTGRRVKQNALAFKRILVALDGTDASQYAVAWARELAMCFRSRVRLLHVDPRAYLGQLAGDFTLSAAEPGPAEAPSLDASRRMLKEAEATLRRASIPTEADLRQGSPQSTIVDEAREHEADLVVLGSHDRGPVGRMFLGSMAESVKGQIDCSALIARAPPRPERVLIAVDGSPVSRVAAATGIQLTRLWGTRAHVIYVVNPATSPAEEERRETLRRVLAGFDTSGLDPGVTFDVEFGDAAERIARAGRRQDAQLIVTGSNLSPAGADPSRKSTSTRVSHRTHASVLTVKVRPR